MAGFLLLGIFLLSVNLIACGPEPVASVSEMAPPEVHPAATGDGASDSSNDGDTVPGPGDDSQPGEIAEPTEPEEPTEPRETATFSLVTIDDEISGLAYLTLADMNADGSTDLVVSSFGQVGFGIPNGEVTIYFQGAAVDSWTKQSVVMPDDGIPFPN